MPLITLLWQSLFKAYTKVSETQVGKGMKKDVFWGKVAKVHQSTNILPEAKEAATEYAQELLSAVPGALPTRQFKDSGCYRNGGSCQTQYETLQHDVLRFIALYEAIKTARPKGLTEEEIQAWAAAQFQQEPRNKDKTAFKYMSVYLELRSRPGLMAQLTTAGSITSAAPTSSPAAPSPAAQVAPAGQGSFVLSADQDDGSDQDKALEASFANGTPMKDAPSKKGPPDEGGKDGASTELPAPKRIRPLGAKAAKDRARTGFPCPESPGTGKAGLAADISRSVAETNGALLGVVAGLQSHFASSAGSDDRLVELYVKNAEKKRDGVDAQLKRARCEEFEATMSAQQKRLAALDELLAEEEKGSESYKELKTMREAVKAKYRAFLMEADI